MALPTKPDMTHVWASGGAKVAPGNTKIDTGWTAEVPPFQWENWSQNRQDAFLDHINKSGFPVWDGLTNYEAAGQSLTKGSDGIIYKSVAASGPSTTVQDPVTDVSDTYWTVAFADVGAFLTQAAGDARYTQRANNLSDVTNAATARTNLGVTNAVEGGLPNSFTNLKMSTTGTNAGVTISADSITLKNASNQQKVVNAVAVGPSFAVAGANGLDVGAANSQAASTYYYTYVIWNGTTVAGLLSLSATSPTLPSGYTHFARTGWVRTDATANKFPFAVIWGGRNGQWKIAPATNMTATPVLSSGVVGNPATGVYVATSLANFIAPTCTRARFSGLSASASQSVAPSANYGPSNAVANAPPFCTSAGASQNNIAQGDLALETNALYIAADGASCRVYLTGWEDNL